MSKRTGAKSANNGAAAAAAAAPASSSSAAAAAASMRDSDTDDEDDGAGGEESKADAPSASSASSVPARFAGQSVYAVLGVARDATAEVIKKAYRRMALSCHPDLNKSPSATAEFQYLSRCHELLSDPAKRKRYDASGCMDGASAAEEDMMGAAEASEDAYEYWRSIFPKISTEDIDSYREKYIGGDEELQDLSAAYKQYDGDLQSVFESVPFASSDSVSRLCALLNKHAGAHITRAQQTELKRSLASMEGGEAAEAEEALKELNAKEQQIMRVSMSQSAKKGAKGNGSAAAAATSAGGAGASAAASGEDALALIIQQRARDREKSGQSFLQQLEAKYGGGGAGAGAGGASKGKKKASGKRKSKQLQDEEDEDEEEAKMDTEEHSEPPEEAFAATGARGRPHNTRQTEHVSGEAKKKSKTKQ